MRFKSPRRSIEKETHELSEGMKEAIVRKVLREEYDETTARDEVFGYLLCDSFERVLVDELRKKGLSDDLIRDLKTALTKLPVEQRKQVLAWPREILVRKDEGLLLNKEIKKLQETGDVDTFINKMLEIANLPSTKWTIGYHMSNHDLNPGAEERWDILGTEKDHRDDDLPMAYYSLKYENLYREKQNDSFLYLVRGSESDAHDDNGWYRNNTLSIIHKVRLMEMEEKTKEIMQEVEERRYEKEGREYRRSA